MSLFSLVPGWHSEAHSWPALEDITLPTMRLHRTTIAMQPPSPRALSLMLAWSKDHSVVKTCTAIFILAIIWPFVPHYQPPALRYIDHSLNPPPIMKSPFDKTMAIIRWNHAHKERLPLLQKYEPFFHTVQFVKISQLRLTSHYWFQVPVIVCRAWSLACWLVGKTWFTTMP